MSGSSHDQGGFFPVFADNKMAIANDKCTSIKFSLCCSFQVICVRAHKWLIGKKTVMNVWTITHQLYLISSSITEIDISDSRAVIQYAQNLYATCSF